MARINQKAQSWSIDVALGVVIFMGAFLIVYTLLSANPNTKVSTLTDEASLVNKQFSSDTQIKIISNNEVNISKLLELKNISYDELKRMLRIEGDFCIYFEDEKGNLVLINNSYRGVGASSINLSGVPCG